MTLVIVFQIAFLATGFVFGLAPDLFWAYPIMAVCYVTLMIAFLMQNSEGVNVRSTNFEFLCKAATIITPVVFVLAYGLFHLFHKQNAGQIIQDNYLFFKLTTDIFLIFMYLVSTISLSSFVEEKMSFTVGINILFCGLINAGFVYLVFNMVLINIKTAISLLF